MRAKVTSIADDARTCIQVYGDIDVASAPQLRQLLIDLVNEGHVDLTVDFGKVEFIDSVGLGALVGALKRARQHDGDLRVVSPSARVLRVLDITGLTEIFSIPETTRRS